MRSRFGIFFGALALLQILGGHWALLQTSAWLGMIVQYSQRAGLKAGLVQTFDGKRPCPVCKANQDGKKQEQKKVPVLQAELKKDYLALISLSLDQSQSLEHSGYLFRQGCVTKASPSIQ